MFYRANLFAFSVIDNRVEKVVIPFKGNSVSQANCMMLTVWLFAIEDDYDGQRDTQRPMVLNIQEN